MRIRVVQYGVGMGEATGFRSWAGVIGAALRSKIMFQVDFFSTAQIQMELLPFPPTLVKSGSIVTRTGGKNSNTVAV